jgi:hypothetical protein
VDRCFIVWALSWSSASLSGHCRGQVLHGLDTVVDMCFVVWTLSWTGSSFSGHCRSQELYCLGTVVVRYFIVWALSWSGASLSHAVNFSDLLTCHVYRQRVAFNKQLHLVSRLVRYQFQVFRIFGLQILFT